MGKMNFDALEICTMASGHLCLNLSDHVDWDEFPDFANNVLLKLDGVAEKKSDAVDIRLWAVRFGGCNLSLVFDDYPLMVSLESHDAAGDTFITSAHRILNGVLD